MALTVATPTDRTSYPDGNQSRTVRDVTFDSGYVTDGEVVTAAELGLTYIDYANADVRSATGAAVNVANADFTKTSGGGSGKVVLYDETPAEVANAADVATTVVRIEARGW